MHGSFVNIRGIGVFGNVLSDSTIYLFRWMSRVVLVVCVCVCVCLCVCLGGGGGGIC